MTILTYRKNLIDKLHITNKDIVLDYGCGKGYSIEHLISDQPSPRSIYAVDSDQKMIDFIYAKFPEKIAAKLIVPKICDRPEQLSNLTFDKIICHNVLECIENKHNFINSLYNHLAKNGILLISHHDFDSTIYNSKYKDLTRNMIHYFADTKQEWQKYSDGQMGRKIPGLVKNGPFKRYDFETWRIVETEFKPENYGYIMADMMCEVGKNQFTSKELTLWREDLEKKSKTGDYYFAIDLVVALLYK